MEEPKLADYGIDKKDFDHLEQRQVRIFSRLVILATLLSISGSLVLALTEKADLVIIILYLIGGAMFGYFICSLLLGGIYQLYSRLFNEEYRKAEKYREAKAEYDAWWVRTKVEFWRKLSGRGFERELANIYSKQGYEVSLTPITDDRGIDIVLQKDRKYIIVQCKAHKKPVGPAIARELYGTLISAGAHEAHLASTSGFSKGTIDFVKDKPIKLVGLETIIHMQKSIEN
ncbi:MAG: restriction endonuclease [Thermodesulfobacteriota bacterium]